MWTRAELKESAKSYLHEKYWWYVLISFLMGLVGIATDNVFFASGGSGGSSGSSAGSSFGNSMGNSGDSDELMAILMVIVVIIVTAIVIGLILGAISLLFRIFALNHVMVGFNKLLREKRFSEPDFFGAILAPFKNGNYMNVTKAIFMRDLYVFLWSLLFIIPGIIAKYRYRFVVPLMSEHPDMPWKEALELSKQMSDGEKWNMFVFDLSFIGWAMLSIIIPIGWFYAFPYMRLANIELYETLRDLKVPQIKNIASYQ